MDFRNRLSATTRYFCGMKMFPPNRVSYIAVLCALLACCSCSTIHTKYRKGMDRPVSASDFSALEGTFSNTPPDTVRSFYVRELIHHFITDTIACTHVFVRPETKRLHLDLYNGDSLLTTKTLKGRYRKGYFRTRHNVRATFPVGPVLWVIAEDFKYVGVTNEGNLVVLNSGGSGVLLFFVVPLGAGGGGDFSGEYPPVDQPSTIKSP